MKVLSKGAGKGKDKPRASVPDGARSPLHHQYPILTLYSLLSAFEIEDAFAPNLSVCVVCEHDPTSGQEPDSFPKFKRKYKNNLHTQMQV